MLGKYLKSIRKPIYIFLFAAIIMGSFIRLWKLTTLPFPPNGDETAFGYYGWSILHHQSDEFGNKLPLYFPSIGDYKYPVLAYLNVIPAAIFGLSEITIRFWSVLSGILLIPLTFFISLILTKSKKSAVASAWLIALSPWSISLSRFGYEANVAVTITSLAILLLLISTQKEIPIKKTTKDKLFIVSITLFVTSLFCYGAQRVFIPAFMGSFFLLSYIKGVGLSASRKKILLLFVIIGIISAVSLIPRESRGRASGVVWKNISIESHVYLLEQIRQDGISEIPTPLILTRAFHNKLAAASIEFIERYTNHFTPSFLFFRGDASAESIPDVGILLLIEILLLPTGLIFLLKGKNRLNRFIILGWIIAGPLASSITKGGPHLIRSSITFPAFAIVSGVGFSELLSIMNSKKIKLLILFTLSFLLAFNTLYVLHQLFVHKPIHLAPLSDQGKKEMVETVLRFKDDYKAVVIPKDPYIFFLLYGKVSPEEFVAKANITPESEANQWERVERYNNIIFKMQFDCPKGGKLDVLYVCEGQNIPQNSKIIDIIMRKDGLPAYSLIEFYPISDLPDILPDLPIYLHYMVDLESHPLYPDGIIPDDFENYW